MVFADATRSSCLQPTFSSTTHDPAMFNNNNNYLPNLNQFGPPGQVPVSNVNTAQPTGSTVGPPPTSVPYQPLATFRFLSPTQGTAVPTWVPPASSVSVAAAPGMGVSWQHSVPSTMPWANHSPPNFNAEITPQAAVPSVPVPQQTFMPQMSERCERFAQRAPSASMVCCRKRHSQSDEPPEGPKSKKYLSEKMASWFKQLQITPVQQDGASALWGNSGQDSGWQRFCELEKRLEEDIEEADVDTPSDNQTDTSGEPRLVFAEGVDEILTPDPVLPEAIRNRITNPCMELVLYKEPGSLVRGSISEDTDTVRVIPDTRSSSESDQQSRDQQRSAEVTLGMTSTTQGRGVNGLVLNTTQMHRAPSDTEMFEMADDDMDL